MKLNEETIQEIELLLNYDSGSSQGGIKVHSHSASPAIVAAAKRLYDKKLVDQVDGGYLTSLGREAVEHLQMAQRILQT
ncbi:MAG: TIGR02647 family protein [Candidatus Pelagadaptatus aseana]|uniref:TIGR02647 family protein n=1 Tax=Candidatus Pelagadaptatus aseana TaxID=3120508 RepID=UPI0039B272C1